ncbi:Flagellar motor rotation protein MotB [Cystobacter fuscus DSM 2262]|uniref:Flagellar motor rotation protein MotB n=1 Tax=Cystobacter fuscus (strain ATCC 25194 / DSM 2262 / NBRC 100088 / M29) TaxID=1242864 RepID=S9PFI0_CYSF2|nr:outer membrane exchange protein TraB [Cystobacter fuscus]EPX61112.1 Flagellar motor rotation protein MotB [Cystobacter fuscus DSM 2262]
MSRLAPLLLVLLLTRIASAQDARFDVQAFRPSGAPQDLVGVGQSRPLSHLSISGGAYLNFMLDPLVLVAAGTNSKSVSLVGNRLQLDVMASVGLYNWVEVGVDMPLVLFQGSDNLEAIGTEGFIQSFTPADLRLTAKVAIPSLRRSAEGNGFGGALTLGMSLPTGLQDAFASDGSVTWSPGLVTDYRFESGVLLAFNAGFWLRPARQFADTLWGNSLTFGLGAEVPILRANGITAMGMLTGSTALEKLLNQPQALPTELLFGLRWYTGLGLTFTVGGGGGCGCSPTSPTLRLFTSIIWVPAKTREWEAIQRFKEPPEPPLPPPPPVDPDGDSVIGEGDRCPNAPGPVENGGCPDTDRDGDAVVDRLDPCPVLAAGPRGRNGCPLARIEGNKIVILDQVHFATDQDVILPESFPILEEVAQELLAHEEIQRVLVEAHTDARANDAYNYDLSRRRAVSVQNFLLDSGIAVERVCSAGFGRSRPLTANDSEANMALNRRVEFTILPPAEGAALPPCPPDPAAGWQVPPTKKGGKRSAPQGAR